MRYVEKYGRTRQANDIIIRRMRIACWTPKATITLSEAAILLQQRPHERAPVLGFTHVASLVQTNSRVPHSELRRHKYCDPLFGASWPS